jgi:hypothetical protein
MSSYPSPEALRDAVVDAGGVLTVRVGEVRDAFGYGRLGVHVRSQITQKLNGLGIAHYPSEVPDWQERPLRLYRMGTPIAELIDAVLDPSSGHDDELRQAVSGGAAEVLSQVRALVCQ